MKRFPFSLLFIVQTSKNLKKDFYATFEDEQVLEKIIFIVHR